MPIDTAEKRRSLSGIQHSLVPGITPNAAKDQEWRQEAGWSYSGILAGAAAALPVAVQIFLATLELIGQTSSSDVFLAQGRETFTARDEA